MKFLATLAIVAAVRLSTEEEAKPTWKQFWTACNTNDDNVIDFKEAKACITKYVPKKDQKKVAEGALKLAVIPKSNWNAVAEGIAKYTKVSKKDALAGMKACNTDKDDDLDAKEVMACLKKNAKALGLKSKKDWKNAVMGLAQAAVLEKKTLKAAFKKWSKEE